MNKAIFIDKDGTLIKNIPFNVDINKIALLPNVEELKQLQDRGYLIIVISNQSGVAKGLFSEDDLIPVKKKLVELLKGKNIILNGFYYCPHDLNGKIDKYKKMCQDHKPQPGMILKAAKRYNIDLLKSWVVGDSIDDIEAGNKAKCKIILITNKKDDSLKLSKPNLIAKNLKQAIEYILNYDTP